MPALVAGIHVFLAKAQPQDVDGRDKPGHDAEKRLDTPGSALFVLVFYLVLILGEPASFQPAPVGSDPFGAGRRRRGERQID
jgi:hypothetical protein